MHRIVAGVLGAVVGLTGAAVSIGAGPDGRGKQTTQDDSMTAEQRAETDRIDALIRRVGGQPDAELVREGGVWRCGQQFTEGPLPVRYPRPTPPGAIEIKYYPSVRGASVSGRGNAAAASSRGFMPLFRHISSRGIEMTVPVEMDYAGLGGDTDWRMEFLYRFNEQAPAGEAENGVLVEDSRPVWVVSVGCTGGRSPRLVEAMERELDAWLAAQDEWRATGEKRWLSYNGPMVPPATQWYEVQYMVERTDADGLGLAGR